MFRNIQSGELAHGRIDINQLSHRIGLLSFCYARYGNHERDPDSFLVVAAFRPELVFTQLPAVITQQDNNCVLGHAGLIKRVEDSAYLGIKKADARPVSVNQFSLLIFRKNGKIVRVVVSAPGSRFIYDLVAVMTQIAPAVSSYRPFREILVFSEVYFLTLI